MRHCGEVAGRQVDDIDHYVILALWKLAIVLEQGLQRRADDPNLATLGAHVPDPMRRAAELAATTDYRA